ncbi:MAG TPA: serine/threonine-protein kinase, partial [Phycisphaerae bacterium]|nr:serine/threonine-protein kinase [Phycisphaerae bacterium]
MQRDCWQSAKDLFRLALDQPLGDREAFVSKQCDDTSVLAEVLRLLRLNDDPSDFLVSPMQSPANADSGVDPLIGRNLGGFVIIRQIGAGGMGAVYEALQEQPRRRAAVKVLRPGIFASRMQRRFEYESEILAKLHHPGIAQVFAAGTFEIGGGLQPWFAMELIEGPPIQAYIKTHSLSRARKLELLVSICDAVQHAHQRGIVHRDLKPDNVLMEVGTEDADICQPKILDFGVARSIESDVQATMHTVAGELVGTLAYMSPEQLSGDPERIDGRCDVFALGVIGYELLSGRLPHAAGRSSFAEVIRAIEHDEPRRLGALDSGLRGDIEVIIAKALEKDVGRRYQSAAELASDLRRYLNDEPVLARPATVMYQFRKFARRNRVLVGGVATTTLALAAGMVLYAREARTARWEADKSRYEADKATAINNFITNDFLMKLLAAANAPAAAGQRLPVADLVEHATERAGTMFAGQPLAEAAVRNEIGTIHYNLGTIDQSAEQFERALALWESQLGPDHVDTLKAVNNLGQARGRQRRLPEAEALYRRALEGRRAALGEDDPYTLVSMNNLADLYRSTGRLDEAEAMLRRTLESQKRVHGTSHKNTITTLGNLAALLTQRDRKDEAMVL